MQATAEPGDWQVDCRERVESVLRAVLPPESREPARLHQAMRYAALGEGKRIRPLLVYAAGAGKTRRLDGKVDAFRPEHARDDRHLGRMLRWQRHGREKLGIDAGAADDRHPARIIWIEL